MPHTQSRYQQDLGFTDGKIRAGLTDILVGPAGAAQITRQHAGSWELSQASDVDNVFAVNVSQLIMRRLGFFEDLQEQFGSQSGSGIAASAQIRTYRPDVIGSMDQGQQLQPRTAFKTKGWRLVSFDVIYNVAVADLDSITVRVDQTEYVTPNPDDSPLSTPILAVGQNGLNPATGVGDLQVITVTPPTQDYFILNDADVWIELEVVTGDTGTFALWGFDIAVEFNFN